MSRRRARQNVDPGTITAIVAFVVPIALAHGKKKVKQYKDGDLDEKVRMLRNWCWFTSGWVCVYLASRLSQPARPTPPRRVRKGLDNPSRSP
jgi:hypothetical protein